MRRCYFFCSLILLLCASVCAQEVLDRLPNAKVQQSLELDIPPGNAAIDSHGQIVFSVHPFFNRSEKWLTLTSDDPTPRPFPDQSHLDKKDQIDFHRPMGVRCDAQGRFWLLDTGVLPGSQEMESDSFPSNKETTPRLLCWNPSSKTWEFVIFIPEPYTTPKSLLNDLAIDLKNQHVFIADTATPETAAIIVIDLRSNTIRRVLQGDPSVVPEKNVKLTPGGTPLTLQQNDKTIEPVVGINPIAIDSQSQHLYFGAMSAKTLYRIPIATLINPALSSEELSSFVERYSDKPPSEGIDIDSENNIYITDINHNAIGVIRPSRTYEILFTKDWLLWPNSIVVDAQHRLLVVVNKLHLSPFFHQGENKATPPFRLLTLSLPDELHPRND